MRRPTDEEIAAVLATYGAVVSHAQCDSIREYIEILLHWNRKLSLTTVTDISEILRFHMGESIFAITQGLIDKGRLADVGSGGGFPGVPLALFATKLQVTLIESNAKKTAFLAEVRRGLKLTNVDITRRRFEDIESEAPAYDYVTARALGQHERLLSWSQRELVASGQTVLWLGADDAKRIERIPGWGWKSSVPIAGSFRVILAGRPLLTGS
jgi:16S rRNA (guanine527-N7)-methyltransferase